MHVDAATVLRTLDPRRSWTGWLVTAGVTLALALAWLSPSASAGLGFPARLAFWLTHVLVGVVVLEAAQTLVGRLPRLRNLPPWGQVTAASLIGAAAFAPLAFLPETALAAAGVGGAADPLTMAELAEEAASSAGPVAAFWLLLNAPRLVAIAAQPTGAEAAEAAASAPARAPAPQSPEALVELLSKLPRTVGRDIVALSAELHYLRVHTTRGEALILMAFGRAVEALREARGLTIHRSHWVAFRHVARVEMSSGGACRCVTTTGLALPVSRPNRATLRAALDDARRREVRAALASAGGATAAGEGAGRGAPGPGGGAHAPHPT